MTHGDDGATGGEGHGRGRGNVPIVMAFVTEVLALQKEDGMARAGLMSVRCRGGRRVVHGCYRSSAGKWPCPGASWSHD